MSDPDPSTSVDFFVSYTSSDSSWAEWIAWVLEDAGFTTLIQAWDFRPGSNFALEMQQATSKARRTIAVVSPRYLESTFTQPEWAAAFADDPEGLARKLVPVVVELTRLDGMFGKVVHINLVGMSREDATRALLAGLEPGRSKPISAPTFPGEARPAIVEAQRELVGGPATWEALREPVVPVWTSDVFSRSQYSMLPTFELHAIPVPGQRLSVSQLDRLARSLVTTGRDRGLFSTTEGITTDSNDRYACALANGSRDDGTTGLYVSRSGQRSLWITLPHDGLGAILDLDELQARLPGLLSILGELPIADPQHFAFAMRVQPIMMLTVGSASSIGHRSSASMAFAMRGDDQFEVEADDTTAGTCLAPPHLGELSDELIARLRAKVTSR